MPSRSFPTESMGPRATSVFREGIVRITVQPAFAGFRRGDNRVPALLRVPGSVAVVRAVTAERRTAGLAGAQMDPAVTGLYAFVARMALRLFDSTDSVCIRSR